MTDSASAQAERRARKRAAGLCTSGACQNLADGTDLCAHHKAARNGRARDLRKRRQSERRCVECGAPADGRLCATHLRAHADYGQTAWEELTPDERRKRARERNMRRSASRRNMTRQQSRVLVTRLLREGLSLRKIAEALGRSYGYVWQLAKEAK